VRAQGISTQFVALTAQSFGQPLGVSTIAKGNAAEAAVVHALEKAGIVTLLPFGGGCPFDVAALTLGDDLLRVQVKCGRVRQGCVEFNAYSTDHGRGPVPYHGRADLIGVYVPALDRVFMVPVGDCPPSKPRLRLEPTRNNQRLRVRFAEDYAFERWLETL
jgi:hypothetical protein